MSVECLSHALSETENKTTLSFASDAIWVCSRLRFCLFLQSFPNLGWFSSSAPSGKEMRMEWEHWCFQLCWKPLKKSHCCFKKLFCADIERKLLLEGGLWRDCFLYLNSCKQPSKSGIPLTCCQATKIKNAMKRVSLCVCRGVGSFTVCSSIMAAMGPEDRAGAEPVGTAACPFGQHVSAATHGGERPDGQKTLVRKLKPETPL